MVWYESLFGTGSHSETTELDAPGTATSQRSSTIRLAIARGSLLTVKSPLVKPEATHCRTLRRFTFIASSLIGCRHWPHR